MRVRVSRGSARDKSRSYTHSGLEMAMFVGPGRECRVELCKKLVSMIKNELRPLGRAIVRGPCTPKVSSNATTKTRICACTRVKCAQDAFSEGK